MSPAGKKTPESDSWGAETDWSLIGRAATDLSTADRDRAWRELVRRYQAPVKRALQRRILKADERDEALRDFFGYVFQAKVLEKVDASAGKFRCYMQGVIRRYALQWTRRHPDCRMEDVHELVLQAPEEPLEIDREDDREWAQALLTNALERLGRAAPRDVRLLEESYGLNGAEVLGRKELAERMGMTSSALNVAVHRARTRFHEALDSELALVASGDEDVQAEREFFIARLLEICPDLAAGRADPEPGVRDLP